MTSTKTMRTTLLAALAGVVAVLGLLAGPAGAQTSGPSTSGGARATTDSVASGTCVAVNDSTCSGSGTAVNDSTSSGSANAANGSTASGCSTANLASTASGGPCGPSGPTTPTTVRPTTPTTAGRTLALTGDSNAVLVAMGALALVLGAMLMTVAARRPAES